MVANHSTKPFQIVETTNHQPIIGQELGLVKEQRGPSAPLLKAKCNPESSAFTCFCD